MYQRLAAGVLPLTLADLSITLRLRDFFTHNLAHVSLVLRCAYVGCEPALTGPELGFLGKGLDCVDFAQKRD